MDQKMKNVLGLVLGVTVIGTLLAYFLSVESIDLAGIVFIGIVPLLLVLGATYLIWNRVKAVKAGLPAEDELSKKAVVKAGYYGFFAAIYGALGVMFYNSFTEHELLWPVLDADRTAEAIILISAIVFMASALWMTFRGEVQ